MATSVQLTPMAQAGPVERFDAIIVGAGISGFYQLIRLRELGLTVRVYENDSRHIVAYRRRRFKQAP
jgi:acetone monooxygenase